MGVHRSCLSPGSLGGAEGSKWIRVFFTVITKLGELGVMREEREQRK